MYNDKQHTQTLFLKKKDKTTAQPSLLHHAETLSPAPSICVSQDLPSAGTVFYPMMVPGRRRVHAVQPQPACSRETRQLLGPKQPVVPSCSALPLVFSRNQRANCVGVSRGGEEGKREDVQ